MQPQTSKPDTLTLEARSHVDRARHFLSLTSLALSQDPINPLDVREALARSLGAARHLKRACESFSGQMPPVAKAHQAVQTSAPAGAGARVQTGGRV